MTVTSTPARGLRIAMVGHKGIPALHGGIERHVEEIARRLARRGHRVDVFNRAYHPAREREYAGIRLRRRPSLPSKHLDAGTHTLWCVLESVLSRRYDVLHVHGIGPGIFVGLAAPWIPTVFTFHAQDYRQRKWGGAARWWLRRGEAVAARNAHAVIAVSQILQRYVEATYDRAAAYIPNGASIPGPPDPTLLQEWGLVPGRYLLFVGRLIPDRGLDTLLDAHAGLGSELPLVIAGDVLHDRDYVEALRRRAGSRVVFTGFRVGPALASLYAHATLCVHPSEVEGLPIAVLEAMSHGRAVLVSDIPENLEAIGDSGAVFPVRDTQALGAELRRLLAQPAGLEELGARARQRVREHYDWDQIAAATESIYAATLASPAATRLESHANGLRPGRPN